MKHLVLIALTLALAACGGQDASPDGSAEAPAPDVSAGTDSAVQSCLDLVGQEQYADAVPACLAAVERAPESERAQAALDQARAGLAGVDAGAAQLESGAAELEGAAGAYGDPATD